ncbi:MAG TPA: NAD-dependent epimerase/dehydratase family protein [Propionibacteriaceae bacterium]|nr:NAD-dependent epimerase/dehydratase family protein [Propionibacteriaceae bacterium]
MRAVVVGAGAIGQWTAYEAAASGHEVVLASRSGRPLSVAGASRRAISAASSSVTAATVDAGDAGALAGLAAGADVLVNAVNPPYTDWDAKWPPMASAFLAAAERSGAALVTIGNLYPYGHPTSPITEATPETPNGHKGRVRQAMWRDAQARHQAGRIRAAELRAADYFGPGVTKGMSYLNQYAILPAMRGRTARHIMGVVDAPHAWTYVRDIGRLAAAVVASVADDDVWGRVWHVPTEAPRSLEDVARDVAALVGQPPRTPRPYPRLVKAALHVVPLIRELDEMAPAFEAPYTLDGSAAERRFGVAATPWHEALEETVAWLRSHD